MLLTAREYPIVIFFKRQILCQWSDKLTCTTKNTALLQQIPKLCYYSFIKFNDFRELFSPSVRCCDCRYVGTLFSNSKGTTTSVRPAATEIIFVKTEVKMKRKSHSGPFLGTLPLDAAEVQGATATCMVMGIG
uniref:Uncharacterized protein n=1 Tax=Romanomermis culicivorax TaxID=13658 RepID=A0A915HJ08_ROMCU